MTQLNELAAVKVEYARIYSEAVQKYKQKKEAALSAPEALQELLDKVQQAAQAIALARGGEQLKQEQEQEQVDGQQKGQQPSLCTALNLMQLQGIYRKEGGLSGPANMDALRLDVFTDYFMLRGGVRNVCALLAYFCLIFIFLCVTENLSCLSDYLTPFSISKRRKCESLGLDSLSAVHVLC